MRIANKEKVIKTRLEQEMGRPKLGQNCYTKEGLTAIQPFQFTTNHKNERIKYKRE